AVLLKLNGIKLTDKVYAGQKILVPAENKKVSPSKTLRSYVVKKGDTLYSLAKSSSLTIDELCQLNNMKSSDTLYLGQKIKLPQ
ncbi:MAG TPA: LysM domain-containing protein, partial [Smithellaceae bacterium]|nr:LysM domain-containing protein [Smithellaceae bacterium]